MSFTPWLKQTKPESWFKKSALPSSDKLSNVYHDITEIVITIFHFITDLEAVGANEDIFSYNAVDSLHKCKKSKNFTNGSRNNTMFQHCKCSIVFKETTMYYGIFNGTNGIFSLNP